MKFGDVESTSRVVPKVGKKQAIFSKEITALFFRRTYAEKCKSYEKVFFHSLALSPF